MHKTADNFSVVGSANGAPLPNVVGAGVVASAEAGVAPDPSIDPHAQRAIDELSEKIQELIDAADAPTLLKRLFCQTLDWEFVNQPVPMDALPQANRGDVVEATILARHQELRLCYVRMAKSELLAKDQRKPMERLAKAWPTVLVAFGNFGQTQIDFFHKTLDGRFVRFSLDRSLFGAAELAQAVYAMRAFEVKTEEPAPQLEVAERLERQFKRIPRRLRRRRGLDRDPFWRELPRHKLLTAVEEQRLRRQFQVGERCDARDKLVLANLRLVVWVACRFQKRGVAWDDLIQEGVCGLIRAADKYDPERGFKFSTYATWWIMQGMTRALAEQPPFVTTPAYWAEKISRFRKFWKFFLQEHGFAPSDRDVQEYFELSRGDLQVFRQAVAAWFRRRPVGMDIPCMRSSDPHHAAAVEERTQTVAAVITARLDARSADIIRRRFGLGDRPEETLEEIGQSLRVTRERIRQIEKDALHILRHPVQARKLEPYVA